MCNSKSIRVDILEEAVWKEVKMVLKEPEAMTKVRLLKYENKQAKDEIEKRASIALLIIIRIKKQNQQLDGKT